MLGMTYGKPEHRSPWVRRLGDQGFDIDKIGREFWDFISADPRMYIEIMGVALRVAYTYRSESGKTLAQAIQDATNSLSQEIEARYSDGQGGIDWQRLVDNNM
jgi:hypothetical protein